MDHDIMNVIWFDHFSNASQKFHISNEGLFTNNNS